MVADWTSNLRPVPHSVWNRCHYRSPSSAAHDGSPGCCIFSTWKGSSSSSMATSVHGGGAVACTILMLTGCWLLLSYQLSAAVCNISRCLAAAATLTAATHLIQHVCMVRVRVVASQHCVYSVGHVLQPLISKTSYFTTVPAILFTRSP